MDSYETLVALAKDAKNERDILRHARALDANNGNDDLVGALLTEGWSDFLSDLEILDLGEHDDDPVEQELLALFAELPTGSNKPDPTLAEMLALIDAQPASNRLRERLLLRGANCYLGYAVIPND